MSEAELRELREIEARVMAGTEPILDGQVVMLQSMRSLGRPRRHACVARHVVPAAAH